MTFSDFQKYIDNDVGSCFETYLSEAEKVLTQSLKRIVIRGKRNRGVPVLFTAKNCEHARLLAATRKNFVSEENNFFFANLNSDGNIQGASIIRKMASKSKVKNISAITSTKLRKHLATLSQLFNISDTDLQQLSAFMGHTVNVHLNNYKLPDDVYQTAKISKLLLLSEKGNFEQYKGKKLEDIEISPDEEVIELVFNEQKK